VKPPGRNLFDGMSRIDGMITAHSSLAVRAVLACVVTAAPPSFADETPSRANVADASPAEPSSPRLARFRQAARQVVAAHRKKEMSTIRNTPAEIMQNVLAFGCKTTVYSPAHGKSISAVGSLCYGTSCGGYRVVSERPGGVVPRLGLGRQRCPGELLAVLAQGRVAPNYPVKAGDFRGTINDLVEWEKSSCREGADLGMKLIGLAYYVRDEPTWRNDRGETWSIERMVADQLKRPTGESPPRDANQLIALAYVCDLRAGREQLFDGEYAKALNYLEVCAATAFVQQQADGSWHTGYFEPQSPSDDKTDRLLATGQMLRWLTPVVPKSQLGDPRIVKAATFLVDTLADPAYLKDPSELTPRQIVATRVACRALSLYDRQAFGGAN
jgi:hypothetical protein